MNGPDIANLAELHISCFKDSLVGALGEVYVRRFYDYVTTSEKEFVAVERDRQGRIIATAVLSLEPVTLNRRLLLHTPLLPRLLRRIPSVLAMLLSTATRSWRTPTNSRAYPPATRPELILILTAPAHRSKGLGGALIRQIERRLEALNVSEYEVRTLADPQNAALRFYRRLAFVPAGHAFRLGTCFQVFTRTLRESTTPL